MQEINSKRDRVNKESVDFMVWFFIFNNIKQLTKKRYKWFLLLFRPNWIRDSNGCRFSCLRVCSDFHVFDIIIWVIN
ncbi:MAG TPA: hypothetical protein DCF89_06905 [Flavobacteriales bacterium]|nr:hypothetical protein [Flavobacteriales bacterium]